MTLCFIYSGVPPHSKAIVIIRRLYYGFYTTGVYYSECLLPKSHPRPWPPPGPSGTLKDEFSSALAATPEFGFIIRTSGLS